MIKDRKRAELFIFRLTLLNHATDRLHVMVTNIFQYMEHWQLIPAVTFEFADLGFSFPLHPKSNGMGENYANENRYLLRIASCLGIRQASNPN